MSAPLDTSILCRAAVALPATATGEMMYMPGGLQTITPIGGGKGEPITVRVDAAGAAALNQQHAALVARGKKPMFDFNHEDGAASFWPSEFVWKEQPAPGIYCRGEWTASGKSGVEGKEWRQFSPVFHVSKKTGATPQSPAAIVCREWAKPNMGGLVNDPAFHAILPLWAKDAGAAGEANNQPNHTDHMTEQEKAALQSRIQNLESEISALKAKNSNESADALKAKEAELRLAQSELRAADAQKEIDALKAKNDEQATAIKARNKADAESAVKRAVERHAIPAKDLKTQDALVAKATDDPGFCAVIDAMQGNPALGGRITPSGNGGAGSGVVIVNEAAGTKIKAYAALVCRNAKLPLAPMGSEEARQKSALAREAAALFAKDLATDELIASMPLDEALRAADNSDASVGLLSGTLVLQRALPLMQHEYPMLGAITQDFSDAPGLLNQTEKTRIILKPAVQTFDTSLDAAGRPKGWSTVSPAQAVDVPVTLSDYVGVPIVFGNQTLASTVRNLFEETAPQALYALGGYAVNLLTALMTAANFNAYKGTSVTGGETTSGDNTVVVGSTANIFVGQQISGTGIPSNTYVASITDSTHIEITQAATATNTGLTLTLSGGRVPNTYTTYAKALADFGVASLGDLRAAFTTNEVPTQNRFALLNTSYHSKLGQDPSLNNFFAATRKPEIITEGSLPRVQGFDPIEAPWMPTSSNRVGFAGHKASLVLKSRLPGDFTNAVGAMVPGSVTTVTVPGGISVLLVQYVNLQSNYAEWRPEVMLGAAVGERRAGLVITSQ
jgi:hypothetical protein